MTAIDNQSRTVIVTFRVDDRVVPGREITMSRAEVEWEWRLADKGGATVTHPTPDVYHIDYNDGRAVTYEIG